MSRRIVVNNQIVAMRDVRLAIGPQLGTKTLVLVPVHCEGRKEGPQIVGKIVR